MTDSASGQVYWWNTETDETTALGAPKPDSAVAQQPQEQGMRGGIMGIVAEGMAFGMGSAMAHRAVDSIMGPRTMQVEDAPQDAPDSESGGGNDDWGGWGGGSGDDWD